MAKEKLSDAICFRAAEEAAAFAKYIAEKKKITIPEAHRFMENAFLRFITSSHRENDAAAVLEYRRRLIRELFEC
jgi:hypothetical protein